MALYGKEHWCLARQSELKGDGVAKHVSRNKPHGEPVGHPLTEGGEERERKVSNIHHLCEDSSRNL